MPKNQSTLQSYEYPLQVRELLERIDFEIERRSKLVPLPPSITGNSLVNEKQLILKAWSNQ